MDLCSLLQAGDRRPPTPYFGLWSMSMPGPDIMGGHGHQAAPTRVPEGLDPVRDFTHLPAADASSFHPLDFRFQLAWTLSSLPGVPTSVVPGSPHQPGGSSLAILALIIDLGDIKLRKEPRDQA